MGQASSLPVRAASLPPVPAPDVRGGRIGTRGTDAPPTGRQGCLPHTGGSNLRVETYTANALNPYTQRTVPGFAEVQGTQFGVLRLRGPLVARRPNRVNAELQTGVFQ